MPGIIAHKGNSLNEVVNHQWITTEGVFGIALGVSTSFVFLFVLFGAMLDKAGAGNYFIQLAFSLLGHLRGGPAKAAVVSSGMTGLISGSSIANVVTTGTFTIPLMKRVGFPAEKAGAIEVAASTNGQLTPPVMGAAAFLMVEFVGIPYIDVIRHAFLPAIISYIALVYIVHLEALKARMQGLPKPTEGKPMKWGLISFVVTILTLIILSGIIFYLSELTKAIGGPGQQIVALLIIFAIEAVLLVGLRGDSRQETRFKFLSTGALVLVNTVLGALFVLNFISLMVVWFGGGSVWVMTVVVVAVYAALVRYASKVPDLELDDPNSPVVELPETRRVVRTGLHFLLPIIVLIYCLMVLRLSPGLSAFWATVLMMFILVTQRPLLALFRADSNWAAAWRRGFGELLDGLIAGARNMIGIGIATATAGIIVGVVSQTGVGSSLAEVVEVLSFGSVFIMLLWTAVLCIILGMGLPTTATYIVVSALLAPVIVTLGQQAGLIVPLIAVHLFVFYFGIIADDTPPVGLAAFAAAAISGGDPIKTGIQGFVYDIRTAVLPFMFIFNTELLLIDVTWAQGVFVFIIATIAMLVFAAATQGYFFAKSRFYETLALLLIAFTMFRPGFWIDQIAAPFTAFGGDKTMEAVTNAKAGDEVRFTVLGEDDVGDPLTKVIILKIGKGATAKDRLEALGLEVVEKDGKVIVDNAAFDSPAKKAGFDLDQQITTVQVPADQPARELMYIPALLLLLLIAFVQRRRNEPEGTSGAATAAATQK